MLGSNQQVTVAMVQEHVGSLVSTWCLTLQLVYQMLQNIILIVIEWTNNL